jgi:hypothetical protein
VSRAIGVVQRQRISEMRNEPRQAGSAFNVKEVGGVHRGPVEKHRENAILSRGHAAARVGDDRMKYRARSVLPFLAIYFQMTGGHAAVLV